MRQIKVDEKLINFYKSDLPKNVLERFPFSENEKALIQQAMRTAKLKRPDMQCIQNADTVLQRVVNTKNPIETPVTTDTKKLLQFSEKMFSSMSHAQEDERLAKVKKLTALLLFLLIVEQFCINFCAIF